MNSLWKDHLLVDFKYSTGYARALLECDHPQLLFEKFGQIPEFEEIVNQNWKRFKEEKLKQGDYQIASLTAPFLGPNCIVGVKYFLDGVPEGTTKGVTRYSDKTVFEKGKGDHIGVFMSLDGDMRSDFCRTLAHELLHIYDWCKRSEKIGNGKKEEDVAWRPSYVDIDQLTKSSDKVQQIVGNILYILYPGERNAFLSQMKYELQKNADSLNSLNGCQRAVEQTTYYRYISMVKRWVRDFAKLTDEDRKETFIQSVNKGLGSNYTTYNKALKRIVKDVDKAEKKLQSIAGKLCYDIYTSYILGEFKQSGGFLIVDPKLDLDLTLGYDE